MGKLRANKVPPKFVTEPLKDKIRHLVKKEVKNFLSTFEPPVNANDKPVDLIPEFVSWLAKSEPKFAQVDQSHMRT